MNLVTEVLCVVFTDCSLREMESVLLLLLGCAVKCDQKEERIDTIKSLEYCVQEGIVKHIQEVRYTQHPIHITHCVHMYHIVTG